jgi:hypothetical protein
MSQSFPEDIFDKAHDISFAVFRVAAIVKNLKLKSALEDGAVDLVKELDNGAVDKLRALVKLSASVSEVKPVNAEVLERELVGLNSAMESAITELVIGNSAAAEEEIDLSKVFADSTEESKSANGKRENPPAGGEILSPHIVNRQSAILDFIRELPNGCRMRDLTARFSDVSERTLRNDLQSLVQEGLIERVGSQGPFSSFGVVTRNEIIVL